jgi:hypothetical protein
MNTATISELKKEINLLDRDALQDLIIRLVKYKKENKELLGYVLFESMDETGFIAQLKMDIDLQFEEINTGNLYYVKKSIRKILRFCNKYIRYSGLAETQVEILIYFCKKIRQTGLPIENSTALHNIYLSKVKKNKTDN